MQVWYVMVYKEQSQLRYFRILLFWKYASILISFINKGFYQDSFEELSPSDIVS